MKQILINTNSSKTLLFAMFSLVLLLITQKSISQTVTANTQGTNNGWFYSFWNDDVSGSASMTLGTGGSYSTTWTGVDDFTCGKGWANGSASQVICYSGTFNGGSNGYLAIYGWTENPIIEYYVVENHGSWTPPGGTLKSTFTSDGGTYNVYEMVRTNAPNITGTNTTFNQYWSVRTTTRSSGTVTFANHVAAWAAAGMPMGTKWDYQILETEGYQSTGSSNVTISTCATTVTPTVTISAPANNSSSCSGASVTITALPTISTGSISKVDYYDGTTLLGTVTASPYNYTWTSPSVGSHTIGVIATSAASVASTEVTETITVNALPTISAGSAIAICSGTATTLTATGGATYKWNNSITTASNTVSPTATTTYTVTGTNASACSATSSVVVTVNSLPTISAGSAVSICSGTTTTLTATGGTSYKWSNGTATAANSVSPTATTTYTVTGTNASACPTTSSVVVTVNALPTISAGSAVSICSGSSTTLTATGGTSYVWNNGTAIASNTVSPTATTTYTVTGTNASACSATSSVIVTVNAAPAAPTVTTPVNYTQGATATALTATGTALKWYTTATGGTALTAAPVPSTTATGTTNYYVSQTTGSCESPRANISVIVSATAQTISLKTGWNIIGCPISGTTALQSALSSIWTYVQTVKNLDAFYSSINPPAMNSLLNVQWGQGYMVNVTAPCTLDWIAR